MDPTAAPVDLVISGKTYKAYPLRDRDHEEYNKWVRREYIARCKDIFGEDSETMKIAIMEATRMVWIAGPGRQMAMTVAGIAKMACLMTRTTAFTEAELANDDNIHNTIDVFSFLHNVKKADVENEEPEQKDDPVKENPSGN